MAELLRNIVVQVNNRPHSKIERVKSIVEMGVGVGAALGFTLAFAMNERYYLAGGMLFAAVVGGYAVNGELKDAFQNKKAPLSTVYVPPEAREQTMPVMRADLLRGLFSSYREVPITYPKIA